MAANPLIESELLREIAPYTLSGYQLFRDIVETDGAIPAKFKTLFVAVAAVNKGYIDVARRALSIAHERGLTKKEAVSGLILLSSLRGEGAALAYQGVVNDVYPRDRASPVADYERQVVASGEAEADFKQYFGTIPDPLQKMLDLSPKGADAYYLMRKGTIYCNTIEPKYAELCLVAVLASDYSSMVARHIGAARAAQATDTELAEAILCSVPSSGIAAVMGAAAYL
ncbi:carboxymuconolactone decarboxylase [Burkholderia sp. FL-7-2-10-S1-D7]|uniref:carboxymuconolactone decarboxylase family protein n=1 Tax=Burkholderia sp. FL-7-2-10-S1-D7 TaxID=1637866 RepID=UPI00075899A7|nr:carboxymuconolactone decarboxylase family protein [Burkholderia sp. FL-7-2-10-S1-D7]KVF79259.1 carboxymuconolactone decarboxylase [Burkholderia sp. FL-7-2-10-S1-D7]